MKSFPEEIRQLKNLKSINFKYNFIEEVPSWLTELPSLESLHLDFNKIKNIPDSMSQAKSLRKVYLGDNSLKKDVQLKFIKKHPSIKFIFDSEFYDGTEDQDN